MGIITNFQYGQNSYAAASASSVSFTTNIYNPQQPQNPMQSMMQGFGMLIAGFDMIDNGQMDGSIMQLLGGGQPQQAQAGNAFAAAGPNGAVAQAGNAFAAAGPGGAYANAGAPAAGFPPQGPQPMPFQPPQQQQPQGPMGQMRGMMMQFMQMMMQMLRQRRGMGQQQQQPQQQQQQNPMQQMMNMMGQMMQQMMNGIMGNQQNSPFGNAAAASAGPGGAAAAASAGPGGAAAAASAGNGWASAAASAGNSFAGASATALSEGKGAWGDPHYDIAVDKNGNGKLDAGESAKFDHKGIDGHTYNIFEGDGVQVKGKYVPHSNPKAPQVIGETEVTAGQDKFNLTKDGKATLNGQDLQMKNGETKQLADGTKIQKVNDKEYKVITKGGDGSAINIKAGGNQMSVDPEGTFQGMGGILGDAMTKIMNGEKMPGNDYWNKYDMGQVL